MNSMAHIHQKNHSIAPLCKLWLLRMLVPLDAITDIISDKNSVLFKALIAMFDLDIDLNASKNGSDKGQVSRVFAKLHERAEAESKNAALPKHLDNNLRHLKSMASLSDTDITILALFVCLRNNEVFSDIVNDFGSLSSVKAFNLIAIILDLPNSQIKKSFATNNILFKSGLLTIARNHECNLLKKVYFLSKNFVNLISEKSKDPAAFLNDIVSRGHTPELSLDDYPHMAREFGVLRPYLKNALLSKRKGVNIFIHGLSGMGKTQLARVLAHDQACALAEINFEDDEDVSIEGHSRLKAFRAAQCLFANSHTMILFDDAENIFGCNPMWSNIKSPAQDYKGWMNRMLEQNSVPTLWVSNSISEIDPAFIRRFDMVIKMRWPAKVQRQQFLEQTCSDILNKQHIENLSKNTHLSQAVIRQATSVVSLLPKELSVNKKAQAFEMVVGNTLEAQGYTRTPLAQLQQSPVSYDTCFANVDIDLDFLYKGISQTKDARLCFYGAPGTGKTAYGKWLVEQAGMRLITKRASDLISSYVGCTEKNIAEAFREAELEGAALMIDEVDSFLQDRRQSSHSWETTKVNEMLTQMESFNGVFIASTNLMSNLDQAVLRRFDLKLHFDYLRPEQTWALLKRYSQALGFGLPSTILKQHISALNGVTPGDFAAIARQHRFKPLNSSEQMLSALQQELNLKEGIKQPIGFIY